jgi:hypothetical protein
MKGFQTTPLVINELQSCGRLVAKELRSVGDKQNAGWYVISTVV